jgi:hypothetical protein
MANTVIQLKWSNLTDAPASLNVGEPAYSNTSHKLFIGDSVNNAIAIGGKYYVDQQGQIFAKINAAFDVANTAMVFTTSTTAPVNPTIGDIWYYTTDDVIYQYVNDGITSYWIDIQTPTLSSNGADLPLIANTTATSASIYANSAFSKANNALANTTGTFNGSLTTTGNVVSANFNTNGSVSGSNFIGSGSQLTGVVTKTTGSWTLNTGTNTVSLTVPPNGTYSIWVNGNIPNGICVWNATVTVTNTNVPVIGNQYAWYYLAGNALVFTAIPTQIIGTNNTIITDSPSVGTTTNVFTFGITNNSGSSQVVNWGYNKL